MSYEIGTATDYADLLNKLNTFLTKGHALKPAYTGTGTGLITLLMGTSTSVQETITVTFSSSSAFSVVGSVTGAMGSGTVGSAFSHARCTFTITAGGTAWAAADNIAFVMTPPWIAQRATAGSEYIWQAPGNANTDQIFVGAKTFSDVSADYFNWRLLGATGFDPNLAFTSQPGAHLGPWLTLWNASIPYWFVADGRRVIVVAKISTYYCSAYLGLLEMPYGSPGAWPYPLVVGGNMAWTTEVLGNAQDRWSNNSESNRNWFTPNTVSWSNPYTESQLRLRLPSGVWLGFTSNYTYSGTPDTVFPYANGATEMRANLDGSYPKLPIILNGSADGTYGQFDSAQWTPGHGNAAENILVDGRESWLVVPNVYRNGKTDFAAIRLA